MKMKDFAKLREGSLEEFRERARKEYDACNDVYVYLEAEITIREIEQLIRNHMRSDSDANEETLRPYIVFLANRWERIKGTAADYQSMPNSYINGLCDKMAQAIVRVVLSKTKAAQEETNAYLVRSEYPEKEDDAIRQKKLRERVAGCVEILFQTGAELLTLMTTRLDKKDWENFLECCDLQSMKQLLLGEHFIKQYKTVADAVVALAESDDSYSDNTSKNAALLFCLIEIKKREREEEKNDYLSWTGKGTGIKKARRFSEAKLMQKYIASDSEDFDAFIKKYPADAKHMYSGHTGRLAQKTKTIKKFVPTGLHLKPSLQRAR